MRGFDVNRFLQKRMPVWQELEHLLNEVDRRGMRSLGIDGARRFGRLYRAVSSDLIRSRTELVDAAVVDYLNDLIARSYAHIYAGTERRGRRIARFFLREFPRLVRREWKPVALSAALLLSGVVFGALAAAYDPSSLAVVIPEGHQAVTPEERVEREERTGGLSEGQQAAAFSSFLFTHNIQVTFLVFSLGLTFGIGTAATLLFNGIPLGALAMQYHQYGRDLFFWAWILPHGIPELTTIVIAGGAGLVLARGLLMPGRLRRLDALVMEARTAARMVVGGMPLLVLAGLIEGTISQMHQPLVPYALKLVFAGIVGSGVWAYLLLAGRGDAIEDDAEQAL